MLSWIDEAALAVSRLSDPTDDEALHDFRVALRRARSTIRAYRPWLKGASPRRIARRLGRLASATNEGRDAEVHIAWLALQQVDADQQPGLDWLVAELVTRKAAAYDHARREVTRGFRKTRRRIERRFSSYAAPVRRRDTPTPKGFLGVTGELLDEHARRLEAFLDEIDSADDEAACHRARIAAKRLRYLLDPLRPTIEAIKPVVTSARSLQDILGDLHDTQVLTAEIAGRIEGVGAQRARRLHTAALAGNEDSDTTLSDDPTPGLIAITRLLRERRDGLFDRLRREWLGEGRTDFLAETAALGRILRRTGSTGIEIERKYLLTALPERLAQARRVLIDQGWLPGDKIRERVRRIRAEDGIRYYRTIKSGSGLRRLEIEESLSRSAFESLWKLTERRRIRKHRYYLEDGDLLWEIDDFIDRDLVIAEVELPREDTPVMLPEWLAPFVKREVTSERRYKNAQLARSTLGKRTRPRRPRIDRRKRSIPSTRTRRAPQK